MAKIMKKIYTKINLITFALLNLCSTLSCSEQNWTLKKSNKNWLETKISNHVSNHVEKMLTRHSYKYISLERYRDLATLYALPAPVSQEILKKQRSNMQKFLVQNEANALEEIKKNLNVDEETWSKFQQKTDADIAAHLREMKKDGPLNAYHNPSLPPALFAKIKNNCEQQHLNINNLNLDILSDPTDKETMTAHCEQIKKSSNSMSYTTTIRFNLDAISRLTKKQKKQICEHELRHAINGHHIILHNIANEVFKLAEIETYNEEIEKIKTEQNNPFYSIAITQKETDLNQKSDDLTKKYEKLNESIKSYELFVDSSAHANYKATQEKTADTFDACINARAAKNASAGTWCGGYVDNHNDMRVLNANWKTSQRIAKLPITLQSLKKKIQQATKINLF